MDTASTMRRQQQTNSSEILGDSTYLRERTDPSIRDLFYLALSDLKNFVARTAPKFEGAILDYGCGGSPYRDLFSRCMRYTRADMLPGSGIDLVLTPDGKTDEPSGAYQGVVSFQVLEHVQDPAAYLEECHRILAADGLLLLTTHGLYFEHKCPNDYYRWTSQGLEELVTSQGFTILESVKLTAGIRGAIHLQHHLVEDFIYERSAVSGLLLRLTRRFYRLISLPLLNFFAKSFLAGSAIVPASQRANLYIGVAVLARKV